MEPWSSWLTSFLLCPVTIRNGSRRPILPSATLFVTLSRKNFSLRSKCPSKRSLCKQEMYLKERISFIVFDAGHDARQSKPETGSATFNCPWSFYYRVSSFLTSFDTVKRVSMPLLYFKAIISSSHEKSITLSYISQEDANRRRTISAAG